MKLTANSVEQWIAKFDGKQNIRLILLYGPDGGAIRHYAQKIAHNYLGQNASDMQHTQLNEDDVKGAPARLLDEAAATPMFGDDNLCRLVSLRGGGEANSKAVAHVLAAPPPKSLILVEAGNLTPKQALRKNVESSDIAMACPCFPLDGAALDEFVRQHFSHNGFTIESSALAILTANLGEDRGVILQELERIILYLGITDGNAEPRQIDASDIESVLGERSTTRIDSLADAVAGGDLTMMDIGLAQLKQAGTSAVATLPVIRRHFQMLYLAQGLRADGESSDAAVARACKLPLHFKRRPLVQQQMRLWSQQKLMRALSILHATEADTRRTLSGFVDTRVAYALLRITRAARVSGR